VGILPGGPGGGQGLLELPFVVQRTGAPKECGGEPRGLLQNGIEMHERLVDVAVVKRHLADPKLRQRAFRIQPVGTVEIRASFGQLAEAAVELAQPVQRARVLGVQPHGVSSAARASGRYCALSTRNMPKAR